MNNVYKILIIILLLSNIIIGQLYIKEANKYNICKEYQLSSQVRYLIGLVEQPQYLQVELLAGASVYFETIGNTDKQLEAESICTYWSNNTKDKIDHLFYVQHKKQDYEEKDSIELIQAGLAKVETFCVKRRLK